MYRIKNSCIYITNIGVFGPLKFLSFCKNDSRTITKTLKIVTADGKNYGKKAKDGRNGYGILESLRLKQEFIFFRIHLYEEMLDATIVFCVNCLFFGIASKYATYSQNNLPSLVV